MLKISISENHVRLGHRDKTCVRITVDRSFLEVGFCDVTTRLEQKLPLPAPFLPEPPGYVNQIFSLDVIQHNNIGPRIDRFISFFLRAHFDVNQQAETSDRTGLLNGGSDRTYCRLISISNHKNFGRTHQMTRCGCPSA